MSRLSLFVAAAWAFASAAAAAPPPAKPHGIAAAFGNTVRALYRDGGIQRIWFQANGDWEAIGRRGQHTSGHWKLGKDGKVCMRQSHPFPMPFRYCTDFPAEGGVGATWTSHDWRGEPMRLTLMKGIEAR
jgi:hypothetical protein